MSNDNIFGEVIHTYTRKQALADGVLIDVSKTAKEAGFKFPVAITAGLYELLMPNEYQEGLCQDYEGRLWDTLYMLRYQIKTERGRKVRGECSETLFYKVLFVIDKPKPEEIELKAVSSPGDNLEPVLTIMLPDED